MYSILVVLTRLSSSCREKAALLYNNTRPARYCGLCGVFCHGEALRRLTIIIQNKQASGLRILVLYRSPTSLPVYVDQRVHSYRTQSSPCGAPGHTGWEPSPSSLVILSARSMRLSFVMLLEACRSTCFDHSASTTDTNTSPGKRGTSW